MSHTTIYFLTKAENAEQAERAVTAYLDTEHFFDYFDVLSSGALAEKRTELDEFTKGWDWKESADEFLKMARKQKAAGNFSGYGSHLINAGQLYAQHLTADTYAFNIDEEDYSVPTDDNGWLVIAVDFHC